MNATSVILRIASHFRGEGLDLATPEDGQRLLRFEVPVPGAGGRAEVVIDANDSGVAFIAILAQRASGRRHEAAELACRINRVIRHGRFDLDFRTGEIRFFHAVPLSTFRWSAGSRAMDELTLVCTMARDFAPAFVGLLAGLQTPLEAYIATSVGKDDEDAKKEAADCGNATRTAPGADAPVTRGESAAGTPDTNCDAAADSGAKRNSMSAKPATPVRNYLLDGLNVRSIIPVSKVETAIRNYLDLLDKGVDATPDRPRMDILLSGPPGTGKTEFVRYLGHKFGLPVVIRTAGDLLNKYVGETEKAIRAAFAEASKKRSILFLDEFDGILHNRDEASQAWEASQTNEVLRAIEEFDGILVAATNLAERLDPAVIRRFTYKLEFGYLTAEGKEMFFKRAFSTELTEEEKARLNSIPDLAPGDFKTASLGLYYLGEEVNNAVRLDALAREADFKNRNRKAWTASVERRIGFAPPACDTRDNDKKEGN